MAKYETTISGSVREFVNYLENNEGSLGASVSLEDKSNYSFDGVDVAVYVYERYSFLGKNRVSLNITAVGVDNIVKITAISSGGSQAVLFKINTFGEGSFLDKFVNLLNRYQ